MVKNNGIIDSKVYREGECWDKILSIQTTGKEKIPYMHGDAPYEPTNYKVLKRLADSGYITSGNTLLDYGCGKGRVCFFLSYLIKCKTIGIEYNPTLVSKAYENLSSSVISDNVSIVQEDAANFKVPVTVDRFYFFRPFSLTVFKKTILNIFESYEKSMRQMLIFLYYPATSYIEYLNSRRTLEQLDSIDCNDSMLLKDPYKVISVFQFNSN
ncbi:methyltransferase domain-containing protein [Selenomonas sp. AB3002]|uniref:methyltransferase domain-containing protein n=1 Tax=Selenomonas sp. AB3002 TaxID=1392502 RepID=UPI0009071A49